MNKRPPHDSVLVGRTYDAFMPTPEATLTMAVEKAIANGWVVPPELTFVSSEEFLVYLEGSPLSDLRWLKFKTNALIFNHDFAKALWGEKAHDEPNISKTEYWLYAWQYHLQQVVIADDPIKYLGEHM